MALSAPPSPDLAGHGAALAAYYPRVWATQIGLRTEQGARMTWEWPWLQAIWDDEAPRIAVQKPAQVRLTTWAIVRALWLAAVPGQTAIYTFPTVGDANTFVAARLDKLIEATPVLRALCGRSGRRPGTSTPTDNVGLKQVGAGTLYVRGTIGRSAALSIPAHALFHDEVDASSEAKLEEYGHRLDAVPVAQQQVYRFSHPTISGYGIADAVDATDDRRWCVRCACGWWGELDYDLHTEGWRLELRCTDCSRALDPRQGEWVATHPSRAAHGYRVPGLIRATPTAGAAWLAQLHARRTESDFPYQFYNMDLGVPYDAGVEQLSAPALAAAAFGEDYRMLLQAVPGTGPYYAGVDQGDVLTVVIGRADPRLDGDRLRVVWLGRLRSADRGLGAWGAGSLPDGTPGLRALLSRFHVRLTVVDANPNSAPAHDLAHDPAFVGRVLCCYYADDAKVEITLPADVRRRAQEPRRGAGSSDERVDLTVDREATLDRTATALLHGGLLLPGPASDPRIAEVLQHCAHNVRAPEQDGEGNRIFRWKRRGGANDYFHAVNYLGIAHATAPRLAALGPGPVPPLRILGAIPRR